ncbi:MAG: hypothetical protein HC938_04555 [Nitrospira sp.]|nr:hypothetical protein [Nitrospira sp.]
MRNQQTLASTITCSGVGLHSGQAASITLRPAPPDTGVVFVSRQGGGDAYLRSPSSIGFPLNSARPSAAVDFRSKLLSICWRHWQAFMSTMYLSM